MKLDSSVRLQGLASELRNETAKIPFFIVELFRFSKSHIVGVPPPGNSESMGQRQISCCRMSTVATYAAAGAGLVFVGLYLVR